jgi:hypothetical protein
MTGFSHLPLQKAIYQRLIADTALMALIVGVYDRPSHNTNFPYVTLGESSISDWSTKTTTGLDQKVILHVWSREGGRTQAATIMERIFALLHEVNFSVVGQTLVLIRFLSSSILLEDDGGTYQGVMRFHALLEAN